MTDAREIIAHARYGQACDGEYNVVGWIAARASIDALHAAGFRILGPDEVDPVTVEKCAGVAERMLRFADTTSEADIAISEAIRALGRKA